MATGPKNAKSQSVTARIAHEIIEGMENVKEEGESTGHISKSIATDNAFQYSYKVCVAIRKAFNEYYAGDNKKITVREARNFQNIQKSNLGGKVFEQLQEMGAAFWDMVSAEYYKEKEKSENASTAKRTISQTIFGSP